MIPLSDSQREALIKTAMNIGASPVDLATVISYETGGTFSPSVMGGKNNKYQGLIQFGPEERKSYGANGDQSFEEQLGAVERFFKDRGFKPGMGIKDLYSTVNAGSPGRYGASDGPGNTVLGHVEKMLASPHFRGAQAMFGDPAPRAPGSAAGLPASAATARPAPPIPRPKPEQEAPGGLLGLGGYDVGLLQKLGVTAPNADPNAGLLRRMGVIQDPLRPAISSQAAGSQQPGIGALLKGVLGLG